MKKIAIITIFPEMFSALINYGVCRKAYKTNKVKLFFYNPRDYTNNVHKSVDDRPFGGGPGMVMLYEPLFQALKNAKRALGEEAKVVYLSPQGKPVTQNYINKFAIDDTPLIFVCGRYEGVDERFVEKYVDEEVSVGDYVVSGGELPAMMLIDAITRLIPGVLGHEQSAMEDSFYSGLLDSPHYTRPAQSSTMGDVPEILLSGHHENIALWRKNNLLAYI